ncbi:Putative calmodulin-binding family protein [Zea mays]|uniref:Putative calmodulin-binding family protein n=1 Tax=Zea mays TaxID=4577 RepID=A0A1D6FY35_MAIZE|nr:Putative calmodulin-binding family protein [Zea mays]
MIEYISPRPRVELDQAATTLQKAYKGLRTRRSLADGAIVAEELWWKTVDSVYLNIKSISFFHEDRQETAASRWSRAGKRVAKVGKGLCKDDKAQKLALQHWLEAIDPRHRYTTSGARAPAASPSSTGWMSAKAETCITRNAHEASSTHSSSCTSDQYVRLTAEQNERAAYEVVVEEGRLLYKQSGDLVNTNEESKWIFVLSTSRSLYVGQKRKGKFQHSSFLSGAATSAAGRLVAKDGVLKAIWPYSGHYLPTEENFREFIAFLEDNNVDLANVKRCSVDDDEYPSFKKQAAEGPEEPQAAGEAPAPVATEEAAEEAVELPAVDVVKAEDTATDTVEPSKMTMMASRPSFKWSTPTGARIGCLQNYPADVQSMALEQVNLSPRLAAAAPSPRLPIPSPRPSPKIRLSPSLHYMGCPTPTGRRSSPKQQQFMGFYTAPPVALTLPKHKVK